MRTVTRVYESYENASNVVYELEDAGFPMAAISVLAKPEAAGQYEDFDASTVACEGASSGDSLCGAAGLLASIGRLAIPGLGSVVAAGWLTSPAVGSAGAAATGGILDLLIGAGVSVQHAHVYSEAVRRGGTMVLVQVEEHKAEIVQWVMDNYIPINPKKQAAIYRKAGWTQFDPNAGPYQSFRVASERDRHFS